MSQVHELKELCSIAIMPAFISSAIIDAFGFNFHLYTSALIVRVISLLCHCQGDTDSFRVDQSVS